MGVIEDEHEAMHCRDCGALVMDPQIKQRILVLIYGRPLQPGRRELLLKLRDAAPTGAMHVTLAGACANCGGGRISYRVGEKG